MISRKIPFRPRKAEIASNTVVRELRDALPIGWTADDSWETRNDLPGTTVVPVAVLRAERGSGIVEVLWGVAVTDLGTEAIVHVSGLPEAERDLRAEGWT